MKVFVTRKIPAAGLRLIESQTDCDTWTDPLPPPREALLERSRGCSGVLSLLSDRIDAEFFDAVGEQLRVVSNFAVGYNNIDIGEAARRGIAIGNTPGVLTDATADIAVALLLAAARRMREGIDNVCKHEWQTWEPTGFIGQDLSGKTLGIVGMGRIGQALARRMHGGWGMKVLYTSRSPKRSAEQEFGAQRVEFSDLLRDSDFVSIHTDQNPETEGLFDENAFAQMKPTSVLVNTARGGIVNQAALETALSENQIFAAGLDVTDPEPLSKDSQLREMPNCIILPHVGSATVASRNAMAEIAAKNLLAGIDQQTLPHPVTA